MYITNFTITIKEFASLLKTITVDEKDTGVAAYMTTLVEVTVGGASVDKALPGFSSRLLVPVKIRPLPVDIFPRTA